MTYVVVQEMVVVFIVEFEDGEQYKVPLTIQDATGRQAVGLLRRKLKLSASVHVELRLLTGRPVDLGDILTEHLPPPDDSDAARSLAKRAVYAIISCPSTPLPRSQKPKLRPQNTAVEMGKVTSLGPEGERSVESDDDDGTCLSVETPTCATQSVRDALHAFPKNGVLWKMFVKHPRQFGDPICQETPSLCVPYPKQLVEMVRSHETFVSKRHPDDASPVPSSLPGVSDGDFAEALSLALAFGLRVRTEDEYGSQLAFYPELAVARHSCCPTGTFKHAARAPLRGSVRCVSPMGLAKGDELTLLYPKADRVDFLLLPTVRARALLKKWYFFDCHCIRCGAVQGKVPKRIETPLCRPNELRRMEKVDIDATSVGAFFACDDDTSRTHLSTRMRDYFSSLGIADDNSLLLSTTELLQADPGRIAQFLLDHTGADAQLRLHRHHWRLSLCRLALLRHFELQLRNDVRPTPTMLDVCLEQLATEAALLPQGHPHILKTYRFFCRLVSLLPDEEAALVQRRARTEISVVWDTVGKCSQLFK